MKISEISTGGFYRLADNVRKFGADAGTTVMVVATWAAGLERHRRFIVESEGERTYDVKASELRPTEVAQEQRAVAYVVQVGRAAGVYISEERARAAVAQDRDYWVRASRHGLPQASSRC